MLLTMDRIFTTLSAEEERPALAPRKTASKVQGGGLAAEGRVRLPHQCRTECRQLNGRYLGACEIRLQVFRQTITDVAHHTQRLRQTAFSYGRLQLRVLAAEFLL